MSESPSVAESDQGGESPGDKPQSLQEAIEELLSEVRSRRRRLSRVKNLLKDVRHQEVETSLFETWLDVQRGLEGYEVGYPSIDERRERIVEAIDSKLKRVRIKARMGFMQKLKARAKMEELEIDKISESPLVLYIAPLTVEVDFDDGGARLLFGHEPIDEVPIDAAAVLKRRKEAVEMLESGLMEPEAFFDTLYRAYQAVLAAEGGAAGERVDLVDVLVPLAMVRAGSDALRKKGLDAMEAYSRAQLAYQLARLRREGSLEMDGRRLDLGAATGGSTRKKRDVLYIPVGAKSGQYYRSLRFEEGR